MPIDYAVRETFFEKERKEQCRKKRLRTVGTVAVEMCILWPARCLESVY